MVRSKDFLHLIISSFNNLYILVNILTRMWYYRLLTTQGEFNRITNNSTTFTRALGGRRRPLDARAVAINRNCPQDKEDFA
jgi:hypothetical protein